MTHEELKAIADDHHMEVVVYPALEPALVGYTWDEAFDGSETIRAVYDYNKTLDCLVKQGMSDEGAVNRVKSWHSRLSDTYDPSRKYPTFIRTNP